MSGADWWQYQQTLEAELQDKIYGENYGPHIRNIKGNAGKHESQKGSIQPLRQIQLPKLRGYPRSSQAIPF
jgi:hypothetical protein